MAYNNYFPTGYQYLYPQQQYQQPISTMQSNIQQPSQPNTGFNGIIWVPEDGTVGPIAIALAIDGEPIQTSRAIVTPAAVDEYFNVTSTAFVTVPRGCCFNVAVENVSFGATAADPATAINVQNANLVVQRVA